MTARHFVVGTAGHVDHGKTTLVRALTGIDTDRLPEEKRRGITIELGFAPWALAPDVTASVIDVPGHRRLVHTMIAGAQGIDLVLLVVAADEGVMPQTREHVAVCELLDIRRAVVAITKRDRVDAETAELAALEAKELLAKSGIEALAVVACSGTTGEGVEAVRAAVVDALRAAGPARGGSHARLSVDRVFAVRGAGTVVTGTLTRGSISTGDALYLVGAAGARPAAARGLHVHDRAVARANAPTRLALNLGGVSLEEVERGDVVTADATLAPTRTIDVALSLRAPVRRGAGAMLHAGTARASARIDPAPDGKVARLRLARPVVLAGNDRFVLRGSDVAGASGAVLGGGVVLDARPPRGRTRKPRRALLDALVARDATAVVRALVAEAAPRPLAPSRLDASLATDPRAAHEALAALVATGELASLGDAGWVRADALEALAAEARGAVADHASKEPLSRGLPLETLRARLGRSAGKAAADRAIAMATRGKHAIAVDGDVARPAAQGSSVDPATARRLERARRAIEAAEGRGLSEFAAREAMEDASPDQARAVLAKLAREGAIVQIGDLWFSRELVAGMQRLAVEHLAKTRTMTVIDFKQLSGLARKQAILMLEHFDRAGVTRRVGDARVLVR